MDERQQEFRVGVMTVAAMAAAVIMVFKFGDISNSWKSGTHINIVLPNASGVHPQTPIRMSGIRIGHVEATQLIADGRGVLVQALIESEYTFRKDSVAQVSRSLLGDGALEIIPGKSGEPIVDGDHIAGRAASDPAAIVAKVEGKLSATLESFEKTGQQWGQLANNLNRLLETTGPDGVSTMQRSALALEQFTQTMKAAESTLASAGSLLSDPEYQKQLTATLTALPQLLNETRGTLASVNQCHSTGRHNGADINSVTTPLAQNGNTIVSRLNTSLGNIETISGELAVVTKLMNEKRRDDSQTTDRFSNVSEPEFNGCITCRPAGKSETCRRGPAGLQRQSGKTSGIARSPWSRPRQRWFEGYAGDASVI